MNICENYIENIVNNGGLIPCVDKASILLIYYNEIEDIIKHMYLCKSCYDYYYALRHEYLTNGRSKFIYLEDLIK